MKTIVITRFGDADVLQVQERPMPQITKVQVLIKVMAAGINRPDIAQRNGHYPPPPNAPADIPGLEVSGIIEACGAENNRWKVGDRVCALLPGGGYAEYAAVHKDHCLPIPPAMRFAEAAALPETVFTVYHNVFERGGLQVEEKFLVHGGSGGIGTTAIQMAKAAGAIVFATAGSKQKCEACTALGATRCINYNEEDFATALQREGVDVILDIIGGEYFDRNIKLLNTDGRLVFINANKGALAEVNIPDIMRRRLTITGSTLRPRNDEFKAALAQNIERQIWPFVLQQQVQPIIYTTLSLHQAAEAHRLMESGAHTGKIVLTTGHYTPEPAT
jgi:putative PIG3 family NAD(P)H quinone oxidoreductase